MHTDSAAEPLDRAMPRRLGSLRLRLTLAVPLLTAAIVAAFEWSGGGHAVWLVLLLSAAQLLLIELWLLRPLRQLAAGCEAMESAPVPLTPGEAAPVAGLALELDRIGHAMRRARGSLWQQDQDARELRRELAQQRTLLEQAHAALEANQRELASLARIDALTGLTNPRAFDETLRREFKRAQRQRGLLAVAVLDLDNFKQFNLAHGTAAGDAALQRVAALLNERFKRDTDVVARLGGEEFVALLPGFGMAEAQGVLESLRDELRELRLPDGVGSLTLSVGLAAASPAHPYLSAQALLQAADEALYIAKHAGRDRLSLAA
ncbi:diguanylate cyclase (GGDEF)-like protein [Pelomonas aquatica]|uniref:diguanylate cyclase n=1 Tax=Pelomonas aquatica TaxID=431058 RepID=A0ABU1Z9E9_9BURK|nr:GGDEF domain-containing protein [Pelomonas aquatica]MDR7297249.1 diguanylate cyclase (GGDEF)-like protein [Pelomonas aquatica]